MPDASKPPSFIRESMWRLLNEEERVAIVACVEGELTAARRLRGALADVEKQKALSRKLAAQSKKLIDELKEMKAEAKRLKEAAPEPKRQLRIDSLVEDLASTVEFADRRADMADEDEEAVLAYSPPT